MTQIKPEFVQFPRLFPDSAQPQDCALISHRMFFFSKSLMTMGMLWAVLDGVASTRRAPTSNPAGSWGPCLSRARPAGRLFRNHLNPQSEVKPCFKSVLPPLPQPAIFTTSRPDFGVFREHPPVCPCGVPVHPMPKRTVLPSSSWPDPSVPVPLPSRCLSRATVLTSSSYSNGTYRLYSSRAWIPPGQYLRIVGTSKARPASTIIHTDFSQT